MPACTDLQCYVGKHGRPLALYPPQYLHQFLHRHLFFSINLLIDSPKNHLIYTYMVDFVLAIPDEVCAALGERARARRLLLNLAVEELAARVGISDKTLSNFERTGRCTLETFVRVLEALGALPDLQHVLLAHSTTIEDMRQKAAVRTRQRAYTKVRKARTARKLVE